VKRIGRYCLSALTALSLLICLAIAVLWIRSYWVSDINSWADGTEIELASRRGRLGMTVAHYDGWHDSPPHHAWKHDRGRGHAFDDAQDGEVRRINLWGFLWAVRAPTYPPAWIRERTRGSAPSPISWWIAPIVVFPGARPTTFDWDAERLPTVTTIVAAPGYRVVAPHWFVVGTTAILSTARIAMFLRARRRHPAGSCPKCGYDLRATPDRCPECGAIPG
jgi:hypothetical protein